MSDRLMVAISPWQLSWARLTGPLRLPLGGALLALAVVRIVVSVRGACAFLACDDFGRFWYATSRWWSGGISLYAATPASFAADGRFYANLNLPSTHLLFVPFALLPRDAAALAWIATGVLALIASLMLIAQETGWRPTWAWAIVFLWWMPTHVQLVTGQLAWVLFLPVTLAWSAARRGRWIHCGAWMGVAVAIKPFLTPLMVWLVWRGQRRAFVVALGTGLAVVVAGVVVFGFDQFKQWGSSLSSADWYYRSLNASLWGPVFRLLTPNAQFAELAEVGRSARPIAVALSTVVVGITWVLCRKVQDVDVQWSMVTSATLLICPLGWVYYGVLLLPGWRARWPGIPATICWLIPTPWLLAGQPSALATVLWGSAATWGLALACVHTWHDACERSA
jgi:hypothetical protein